MKMIMRILTRTTRTRSVSDCPLFSQRVLGESLTTRRRRMTSRMMNRPHAVVVLLVADRAVASRWTQPSASNSKRRLGSCPLCAGMMAVSGLLDVPIICLQHPFLL
jgi:hypothetical protein